MRHDVRLGGQRPVRTPQFDSRMNLQAISLLISGASLATGYENIVAGTHIAHRRWRFGGPRCKRRGGDELARMSAPLLARVCPSTISILHIQLITCEASPFV